MLFSLASSDLFKGSIYFAAFSLAFQVALTAYDHQSTLHPLHQPTINSEWLPNPGKTTPKATKTNRSPGLILPERTASSKASGIEADDVLPYFSILIKTRSAGRLILLAVASIMAQISLVADHKSTSLLVRPVIRRTSSAESPIALTAYFKHLTAAILTNAAQHRQIHEKAATRVPKPRYRAAD
jgi:hypothetical protein